MRSSSSASPADAVAGGRRIRPVNVWFPISMDRLRSRDHSRNARTSGSENGPGPW